MQDDPGLDRTASDLISQKQALAEAEKRQLPAAFKGVSSCTL